MFGLLLQKLLDESNCKPSKIWIDKYSEFFSRSMKSCLQDNDIEIYLTHNEEKSTIVERYIGIFKNKIYKNTTSISKNVYIDKLNDIIDKYNKNII